MPKSGKQISRFRAAKELEEACGFFGDRFWPVMMIARVMHKLHCYETIEPAREPPPEGICIRYIRANLLQNVVNLLRFQEFAYARGSAR